MLADFLIVKDCFATCGRLTALPEGLVRLTALRELNISGTLQGIPVYSTVEYREVLCSMVSYMIPSFLLQSSFSSKKH